MKTDNVFLDVLVPRLHTTAPAELVERESASVAVIFRGSERGEEVLLMRRAEREGDPWTGQVSFPGGRAHSIDRSFKDTAIRETAEEVGIDLSSESRFVGYMDAFNPRNRRIVVVPTVFALKKDVRIRLNKEATSYAWAPLGDIAHERHRSTHMFKRDGVNLSFPSFVYRDYMVWGLTERILSAVIDGATTRIPAPGERSVAQAAAHLET